MIDYTLALALKNAGFPFDFGNATIFDTLPAMYTFEKYPSLEELIEALGNNLYDLHVIGGRWYADGADYVKTLLVQGSGSTPSEAVAHLYLEIKKQ